MNWLQSIAAAIAILAAFVEFTLVLIWLATLFGLTAVAIGIYAVGAIVAVVVVAWSFHTPSKQKKGTI